MIRNFTLKDVKQLDVIMGRGDIIDKIDIVNDIHSHTEKFLVFEEEAIKGFAYAIERTEGECEWTVQVYVDIKYTVK